MLWNLAWQSARSPQTVFVCVCEFGQMFCQYRGCATLTSHCLQVATISFHPSFYFPVLLVLISHLYSTATYMQFPVFGFIMLSLWALGPCRYQIHHLDSTRETNPREQIWAWGQLWTLPYRTPPCQRDGLSQRIGTSNVIIKNRSKTFHTEHQTWHPSIKMEDHS